MNSVYKAIILVIQNALIAGYKKSVMRIELHIAVATVSRADVLVSWNQLKSILSDCMLPGFRKHQLKFRSLPLRGGYLDIAAQIQDQFADDR